MNYTPFIFALFVLSLGCFLFLNLYGLRQFSLYFDEIAPDYHIIKDDYFAPVTGAQTFHGFLRWGVAKRVSGAVSSPGIYDDQYLEIAQRLSVFDRVLFCAVVIFALLQTVFLIALLIALGGSAIFD